MRYPLKWLALMMCPFAGTLLGQRATAQQTPSQTVVVDSSLLERIDALEKQVADQKPGESHLMVVGLMTFGFTYTKTTFTPPGAPGQVTKVNSLGGDPNYELSPMFLWRHGTNFLVEFEPSFDGTSLGVNWADVSYFAAPGLTLKAGYFVLPFGIYNKRLAAGWIDKVAPDPLGIDQPGSDFGVEASGGFQLGTAKWSYDVSFTNGMQLLPDGELQNPGIIDNNLNKTVTGRLALLPFSNSSLEVGVSGLHGGVADAGSPYNNANVTMLGADLSYVKSFSALLLNIKGQYYTMNVNKQNYAKPTDSSMYTFDNKTQNLFAQASIRPTGAQNKILKNLELAFRYVNFKTPGNSLWGQNYHEEDLGLDYWITWRTVLKCTYAWSHSESTQNTSAGGTLGNTDAHTLYLQFSIQL